VHLPRLAEGDRAERVVYEFELRNVDVDDLEARCRERRDRLVRPVADAGRQIRIVELATQRPDPGRPSGQPFAAFTMLSGGG